MTGPSMHIDERKTMKRMWTMRGLTLVAAGLLAACGGDAQADGAEEGAEAFSRVINVEVTEVRPETFSEQIRLTGVALADQDVLVAAEESGAVREIFVEKGERVTAGQPILSIDDDVLSAQVAQARAQADLAQQTWERRERLWEEDRVGSEIAYLEARFAAEQTAANLQALEYRLARTTIRAPFDGLLDERPVELGAMVSPGQTVARVVALSRVKIAAGVPERYAPDVRPGGRATVFFDVLPGQEFPATIDYVGASVSPQNRTFPIEIAMSNPQSLIKPQMVANVIVERREMDGAIVVPQDALVRVEDGYVAFVAEDGPDGPVARARTVVAGPSQNNRVVIEEGLESGDRLIVVGQRSVADGDRLNVVGGDD